MGPLGILVRLAIFIGLGPLGGNEPSENASGVKVADLPERSREHELGSI